MNEDRDATLSALADEAWDALKRLADEYHDKRLEQALGLLADVRNDYFDKAPQQPAAPCVLGSQRVNSTAGYCTAHGARWVDKDDVCWGVRYYGAPAVPS